MGQCVHAGFRQPVTTGTVNARVYLAGQDPAGLAAYAAAVSQPGNADYGHFLSPAQVAGEVRADQRADRRGQGLADRRPA